MAAQTSTLILFKDCKILPERNFIVEDIENYLSTLTPIPYYNFQYIRHGLQIQIKINATQNAASPFNIVVFNYCSIQNMSDSSPVYYFVIRTTQLSQETLLLDLVLDVANTFKYGEHYTFTKRTKVTREHKDRFIRESSSAIQLVRKIDLYSEGLTPVLYKEDDDYIFTTATKWSLIYETQTSEAAINTYPVKCYLVPEDEVELQDYDPYIINFNNLQLNKTYYFTSADNPNASIIYTGSEGNPIQLIIKDNQAVIFDRYQVRGEESEILYTAGKIVLLNYSPTGELIEEENKVIYLQNKPLTSVDSFAITGGTKIHIGNSVTISAPIGVSFSISPNLTLNQVINLPVAFEFNAGEGSLISPMILKDIDKSSPRLIKIIKLPYEPVNIDSLIPEGFGYDLSTRRLILIDPETAFKSEHDYTYNNGGFNELVTYPSIIGATLLRDDSLESKIYHSDFYIKKFVYDSFSFNFILERMNPSAVIYEPEFTFNFIMTKTMNSRFLFEFPYYDLEDLGNQDYYNILMVARNNEAMIYSNSYVDYIRTGYNYDVKTKERSATANWTGVALSAIGTAANIIAPTSPLSIASAVHMGTSTIQQIVNAINSNNQAEQNLQAKMTSLMNQSTSVVGSDDLDLMEAYSGNNAKMVHYKLSPKMNQAILDLFYYTGYISNELKIPERDTRYWFNYIQCDPEIIPLKNIPLSMIEELKNRYMDGLTILHNHSNSWDFEQVRENWETWILNLI